MDASMTDTTFMVMPLGSFREKLSPRLVQNGEQASHALTVGFNNFIACLGGTGCTLVVPFLFMWLCKSKQLKAVGKASFIPVIFNVNEPVLFAAPIVLNPYGAVAASAGSAFSGTMMAAGSVSAVWKGAEEKHLPVTARAEAFGAHTDILAIRTTEHSRAMGAMPVPRNRPTGAGVAQGRT